MVLVPAQAAEHRLAPPYHNRSRRPVECGSSRSENVSIPSTPALRCGGEDGDRGGRAVLEVPMPHPRTVEAQSLPQLDDLQHALMARTRTVEEPDGEKSQSLEGVAFCRHVKDLSTPSKL